MHISIITCLPELLSGPFNHSIMLRAQQRDLLSLELIDLRDFGLGKSRQIDDYQYGGGAGMVMMAEPLSAAIEHCQSEVIYDQIIYLTPDGVSLNQRISNRLSTDENLLMICGHYKGIDDRIRQKYVTMEISIGDYVLSGGELAAAVLVDSVVRVIPGVLNDGTSALTDSFQDDLLAPPVYTRPRDFHGLQVPEVLLSGHEANIQTWRHDMALKRTQDLRPDLLDETE